MAKDKTLALTIKIAGKMDKSLLSALNSSQRQISSFSKGLSRIGTVGLAAMGALTTATVAGLKSCANEAVKYQNELGDVIKYVDGMADEMGNIGAAAKALDGTLGKASNGKTYAENYEFVYDAIQKVSTQVPLTREYLAEMTAAMGQSGKTIEQMFQVDSNGNIGGLIKDAAVMAAAWDIEAKEAAEYGAKWENSFNMSHDQVMELANQINYLGAHSATTAAEIANAVNQSASLGSLAGIDPSTTAALADAMLATGVASDRVGTSIKRMALNLSKGSDMTKKQKGVLQEMGLTAEWVSKSMTEDSIGTLNTLFEGIANLPQERRLNAVGQLFGVWAAEGGAKIVNNLDVYRKALEMVADQEAYMNSMQREFDIKTATPEAVRQMRNSAIDMFKVNIGKSFVPLQTQWDEGIRNLFLRLNDNMPQLQQLSGTLADLATKGLSKVGDMIEKYLPYFTQALDYVNNNGPQVAATIGKIAAAFVGMKFAPAIEGLLGGGADLLFGSKSAFGGRSGGLIKGITGAPETLSTMLFGHKLKNGNVKGGMIPGAKNLLGGLLGSGKAWGGNILGGIKGLGGTKIGGGLIGAAKGTASVTGEILKGIYGATFKDLVDGGLMLGGMGVDALKTKAGAGLAMLQNSKAGQLIGGAAGKVAGFGAKALPFMQGIGGAGLEFGGAAANLGGAVWGPIASGFGSLVTGAAPVVLEISGIIAVVSILGDHLEDIRTIIGNVFGEKGVKVFDTFTGKLSQVGDFIKGLFADGGVAKALAPVQQAITGMFGDNAGAAFGGLVTILQSIMGVVGQIVSFATTYVKPIILDIFNFITQTVVPILLQTFTAAAPTIAAIFSALGTAVMTVFTTIAQVIQAAEPIIAAVATALLNVGSVVVPAVLTGFKILSEGILVIVQGIQTFFQGLIDFLTGVFTGNWGQVWEGCKTMLGGAFEAMIGLVQTPIDAIKGIINSVISSINGISVNIPDWVPVWGGKQFGPLNIPMLAQGGFTTGPSIAGEAGTEAVISFQRSARRENIALWQQAGRMLGVQERELKSLDGAGFGGGGDIIFSPQITIMGNADRNEVQAGLSMAMDEFERMYDRLMKRKKRYGFATV